MGREPDGLHAWAPGPNVRAVAVCRAVTLVAAAIVAIVGSVGLLGWLIDVEALKALYTGGISIKATRCPECTSELAGAPAVAP